MIVCPARPRLIARYRGGPVIEIWRAKHAGGYISESGRLALIQGMSDEWEIQMIRPLRDAEAVGRIAQFDTAGQIPPDPVEELTAKDDES